MKDHVNKFSHSIFVIFFCSIFIFFGCADHVSEEDSIETERIQNEQRDTLILQFIESRVAQDDALTGDELKRLIAAAQEASLLDAARTPQDLKDLSYEEKLQKITDFAQKMMQDTGRTRISEHNSVLTDTEIPLVDITTGANKYFFGEGGQQRYFDYLAQRFDIGVYPTTQELQGEWTGEMVIAHVAVFNELGSAPIGYDIEKIKAATGRRDTIDFTVNVTGDTTGTIVSVPGITTHAMPFSYDFIPNLQEQIKSLSFTYNDIKDKGELNATFAQGVIEGRVQLYATKTENIMMHGRVSADLFDGYINVSGDLTAHKK